jgi:RNA polymerase sporulation-specific sigma factor
MTKQQQQLVEDNMNLVYFTIARYYPRHIGDEDIIQIGMVGLCRAATSYDDSKGQFSTYAIVKIRSAISYEFRKDNKRVKTISLDGDRDAEHGDVYTLQELVAGDVDEGYVDVKPMYQVLDVRQREIFDLLRQGKNMAEIGRIMGVSHQRIHQQVRIIRKKWNKVMGE